MRSKLLLVFFSLLFTPLFAQLPYTEGFEALTGYTPDVDVIDNLDDYFARMNTACGASDPCRSNFNTGYIGWIGTYYWAGEDHDDNGVGGSGNAQLCITLDPIDISSNTTGKLEISAYYAACDFGCNAYDNGVDFVTLSYNVDGTGDQVAQRFAYYTPDSGTSEFLAYDEDNNGTVDGSETTILTETFAPFSRMVDITGNSLVITICAHMNSGSEEWAIDEIEVKSAAALPVELVDFTANPLEKKVILVWETLSETNNRGFDVQRSTNGKEWQNIGFIAGADNSTVPKQYQFVDENPAEAVNYYRLKQLDWDGAFEYSNIVSVDQKTERTITIFPNPTYDELNITGITAGQITITDQVGRVVLAENYAGNTIDVSHLASGLYQVYIQSTREVSVFTIAIF